MFMFHCQSFTNTKYFDSLKKKTLGVDNLARFGALESLVNGMPDEAWDGTAANRISSIHFLDDDEDDDNDSVRPRSIYTVN